MRRAYHSSRGAVQSEVCLSVIEEPHRGVLGSLGLSRHEKRSINHRDLVVMQMSEVGETLAL